MSCVYKVLHHLGEKSHNLNKLNNNTENNLSSIQKEQWMSCIYKVLHHLGEKSHNLNKLNNNAENNLSSIQKEHFNKGRHLIWSVQSICLIDCFSDSIYGIFLIQQYNSS